MSDAVLEGLLRPPVELNVAAMGAVAGTLCAAAPWALMLEPTVGAGCAVALYGYALYRGKAGVRVLRYQRNMRRLPRFEIRPSNMPVSPQRMYLGRGFNWTQKHTQRLTDALEQSAQEYLQPGSLDKLFRQIEDRQDRDTVARLLARLTTQDAWWNPAPPPAKVGGSPHLHGVGMDEERDVFAELGERVGHMLVVGTTRVGKTRGLEILVTQDIHRGDVVIVIDPKGDAELMMRMWAEAKRAGREDQFFMFHLGYPEISARYNGIGSFSRITEVATRLTSPLPNSGNSAAFKEFAWRFSNVIAKAVVALGRKPSYVEMQKHFTDIEPLFRQYGELALRRVNGETRLKQIIAGIEGKKIPVARSLQDRAVELVAILEYMRTYPVDDPVLEGLAAAFKYERAFFDKIIASVGPLLDKLTTGKTAALLSPDYLDLTDSRPIFEWMQVIRQKGIVYVGLDALSDAQVGSAVGNSMFADLVSVAGQIYKVGIDGGRSDGSAGPGPKINLHLDEFNELMGEEFIPMVNKAGGAGFQVTAYTQTLQDIEAKIGNAAKAQQVVGNFNSLVMLRVKNVETARLLTDGLPEVSVSALTTVSGVTDAAGAGDGTHFTSKNEDRVGSTRVPMLTPADVMSLPKGQAFAILNGGQLWKIRLPLPSKDADPMMPESLRAIAIDMQARYRTAENWTAGADRLTVEGERYDHEAQGEASGAAAPEQDPDEPANAGRETSADWERMLAVGGLVSEGAPAAAPAPAVSAPQARASELTHG